MKTILFAIALFITSMSGFSQVINIEQGKRYNFFNNDGPSGEGDIDYDYIYIVSIDDNIVYYKLTEYLSKEEQWYNDEFLYDIPLSLLNKHMVTHPRELTVVNDAVEPYENFDVVKESNDSLVKR